MCESAGTSLDTIKSWKPDAVTRGTGGEGTGNHPGEPEILPGTGGALSRCDRRIRQARPFACNLTATAEKQSPEIMSYLGGSHDNGPGRNLEGY